MDREARERIWRGIFPKRRRKVRELGEKRFSRRGETPHSELDYEVLSEFELTGENIKNIALSAAFLAASGKRTDEMDAIYCAERETIRGLIPEEVTTNGELNFDFLERVEMEHVVQAMRRELQKTGKLFKSDKFGEYRGLVES